MNKFKKLLVLGMSMFLLTGCITQGQTPVDPGKDPADSGDNPVNPGEDPVDPGKDPSDPGYEPPVVTTNTVSYTVADLAELYGWENDTKYQSFALDGAVDVSSSEGQYNGKYFESGGGQYRLYSSDSGSITFSVKGERELKSITITYVSQSKGQLVDLPSGQAKDVSGKSVTFNFGDAGQVRITAFSVTYTGEKGEAIQPVVKEGWTDEELQLINQYIYGVDVPYVNYGRGTKIEEEDGVLYIQIDNATQADYFLYTDAFVEDEKFVNLEDEVPDNDAYFIQEVQTEAGRRFVVANIYFIDEDGSLLLDDSAIGYLIVQLSDPYLYEWDAELMEAAIELLKSTATIPVVSNISYYEYYMDEDYTSFSLYFYEQEATSITTYRALLEGWTLEDEMSDATGSMAYYLAPTGDLELGVFYSVEDQIFGLMLIKHLPQLDEFPMEAIKEYLNGYEPVPLNGAEYYTIEHLSQSFDIGLDEPYVMDLGMDVWAYGINETKFNEYLDAVKADKDASVTTVTDEDDDGNEYTYYYVLITRPFTDGFYYEYTFMYVEDETAVEISYTPAGTFVNFMGDVDTWSQLIAVINAKFCTPKELDVNAIPELPLGGANRYTFDIGMNDEYYLDYASFYVVGNHESAWLEVLATAGFDVPETPDEDYGYECISADGSIEIDIQYSSVADRTTASIYSVVDFAG